MTRVERIAEGREYNRLDGAEWICDEDSDHAERFADLFHASDAAVLAGFRKLEAEYFQYCHDSVKQMLEDANV